ncbi:pilus assembly PilX family protein [Desulfatitalea alkaliphila]|uniref:PilX N-terminal domain-containing pilus assembly protein n=1 Tax=Desulfatitalea alkaliphila TaxID=2929485 RepID=A0AA41ULU9_9BACT|nr:PilX N-terminal domain-containing pilus assembly protein [Desulfatitalea alkaliphila]MCJ8501931.1 PilX N-terminal domain-containing pilus assembly protein [Desulfatitalea alkaliphila]
MSLDDRLSVVAPGTDPGEAGVVLVVTLLVLLAITILGVAALQTTTAELHIARNEREVGQSFYTAEAAVMEGVGRLRHMAAEASTRIDLVEQVADWHHGRRDVAVSGFRDPGVWRFDTADKDVPMNCVPSRVDPESFVAAVEWRVAPGGSLVMTDGSRLYENRVYGLSTKFGALHLVEVGYCLRY